MPISCGPTISAVVAAYQAEDWISEALESILGQTRPPDEVVVVDDGSTDGTARELERFAREVRIVRQPNRGCPAAFNRAFREARGDFLAMCGADDIWEPQKLEWQAAAIQANPQVDVFFGHAMMIGRFDAEHLRPPGAGLLDGGTLRSALYRANCVCAPSVVIRRALFERLGPFIENFGADDYEYWFRCLRAEARFYYDARPLLRYRQHESNLSAQLAWMDECSCQVRRWYEADVQDRVVVCRAMAPNLFRVARRLVDEGRPGDARRTFRAALRYARGGTAPGNVKALAWVIVLTMPATIRKRAVKTLTRVRPAFRRLQGIRQATPA